MKYQGKITDPKDFVTKEYVDTGLSGKLGTSGDGSNVTAAFTAASSRTNISTGEKLAVIFGKVAKWFADLGAAAFRGVDATPTAGSTNLVESGGVKSAISKLSNPNLLDNWYFVGGGTVGAFPINQRGQSSYSNANAYTIDRWKLTSGSVSVGSSGITLNGTLVQIREQSVGVSVTCSALLSDGTMITPTYNDSTKTFTLTASNKTIVAVKLEVGSEQTLAHQESGTWVLNEIPNYGEELAKCQRYQIELNPLGNNYANFGFGSGNGSNTVYVMCPLPVTLRAHPTEIVTAGTLRLFGGTTSLNVLSVAIDLASSANSVTLDVRANGVTVGQPYLLTAPNDSTARLLVAANL